MRTLSTEQQDALAQTVTRPGLLIEYTLEDAFLRLSSRGTVNALGVEWTGWDVQASGLGLDQQSPSPRGQVILGDPNFAISSILLNAPIAARVRAWRYTVEALALDEDDVVLIFDGVLGEGSGGTSDAHFTTTLVSKEGTLLFTPRRNVSVENGFHVIVPTGIFIYNGEKYELKREA